MTTPKDRDPSELNPAASARRRLLKALGLAAGAGMISVDWAKPAVRLGSLAAHAQPSPNLCDIVMRQLVQMSAGSASLRLNLSISGTEVSSTSTDGGPNVSLELAFQPLSSGTYSGSFQWTLENAQGLTYSLTRFESCCTNTSEILHDTATGSSSTAFAGNGEIAIGDDGDCSINNIGD